LNPAAMLGSLFFYDMMTSVTIGIDEVGRGPLAGPVVVAAVALPPRFKLAKLLQKGKQSLRLHRQGKKFWLKDSKRLTLHQRLICYQHIKNHPRIKFSVAQVTPAVIDQINIAQAANLAAYRAYKSLTKKLYGGSTSIIKLYGGSTSIILDGGLKLPPDIPHKTIIRGDQKRNEIKLASIIAKIHRDRIMDRLHKQYPDYGFNDHQGYGTKKHIKALIEHGPSPIHRLTFLKFLC